MAVRRETPNKGQEERVVVVDRLASVRSALFLILGRQPDITIAGDRGNIAGLADYLADNQATMLLLDWELTGNEPETLIQSIRTCCPGLHIIALSTRPEHQTEALHAGANAFICKGDEPTNVLNLIRGLARRLPQDSSSKERRVPQAGALLP